MGDALEAAATCHSKRPEERGRDLRCVVQERIEIGTPVRLRPMRGLVANARTRERLKRARKDRIAKARLPGRHNLLDGCNE